MTWIIVIILLFWVATLNSRISVLERKLKSGSVVGNPEPQKPPLFAEQASVTASILDPVKQQVVPEPAVATDTNILARLGVIALVLGLGFFFKYSIDQGWINEWTRVVIGLLVGGLMVTLGLLWKEKYGTRAEILAGGGIAVVFFALYAGHGFYNLYNYSEGIAAYVAVSAVATVIAFTKQFRSLASIGLVAAFFAPLFFGIKADQQTFLMAYLSILSAAVFALFASRQWLELPVLALISTQFVFTGWAINFSRPETNLNSWLFSAGLLFIYSIGVFANYRIRAIKNQLAAESDIGSAILILLSSIQFLAYSSILLSTAHPELRPWAGLLGGVILLIGYASVDRLEPKSLNYTATFCASLLLLSAVLWQFGSAEAEVVGVLALSAVGFTVGVLQKRVEIRTWAMVLCFFALGKSFFIRYPLTDTAFLLNPKLGLTLLSAFILGWYSYIYRKFDVTDEEKSLADKLLVGSIVALWLAVSWDIVNAYSGFLLKNTRTLLMSLWWVLVAVGTLVLGRGSDNHNLKQLSFILFGLAICKVYLYDIWALDMVYRVVAFIVLGVVLLTVSFSFNQNKDKIKKLFE